MTWPANPSPNPIRILLVEDDDGDAKAVVRTFQKARIANPIVRALDGIEAMAILRGSDRTPRLEAPYLLLVDLNMPRMDGIQLVTAIREDPVLHDTIIFMLTTSNRAEDKQAAYSLNVTGYILKEKAGEDFLKLFSLVDSYWRIVEMP
ncbi:MAG: response regulator [Terracidiphilus sp.]|jgi:CheY-like chemotaxis protein